MKKTIMILLLLAFALPMRARADQSQGLLLAADTQMNQGETSNSNGQSIGDDQVVPKDQYMATIFSVIPGILFHGSGNFYAEDYQFGTEMLVMEIIGAGISIWGYNVIHEPQHWGQYFGNDTPQAGYWIKAAGVGLLSVSWVGDVATAAGAADDWNKDHQLDLQMDTFNATGVRLTLATNF
ncbi:MAG TPA: hypothetical protein VK914_09030 [bacterium]|nr:hypothetical protein [bacterium]